MCEFTEFPKSYCNREETGVWYGRAFFWILFFVRAKKSIEFEVYE